MAELRNRLGLRRDEVVLELHELVVTDREQARQGLDLLDDDAPLAGALPVSRVVVVQHSPQETAAALALEPGDALSYLSRCGSRTS
jgi:hypothetical protein